MEFNSINEPIQKNIRYAKALINEFNEENPNKIIFKMPQISFRFMKGMINTIIQYILLLNIELYMKEIKMYFKSYLSMATV